MDRIELTSKVDTFIIKYEGQEKGYPNDGLFKGECLSLVKLYIQEVFGIPAPPSGMNAAFGYWVNFPGPLPNKFKKVEKISGAVPQKGDIPIWDIHVVKRPFGHIDIFISGDVDSFIGFDQNFGARHAHKQHHINSDGIVGWLSPILEETRSEAGLFNVTVTTDGDRLRIRKGPSTKYSKVRNLRTGDQVTVFSLSGNNVWLKIQDGYIMFKPERLTINSGGVEENPPQTGLFSAIVTPAGNGIRSRKGPGTRFAISGKLQTDDLVTVFDFSGNNVWLGIREGFIMFKPEWLQINSGG